MGGILTKGLGAPACCGLILARFSLAKCCQYTIVIPPTPEGGGGGGGSRPLAPGEIQNFYTPVGRPNPLKPLEYLQPYNPPMPLDKIVITLTVKGDEPITKEYYVPRHKSKIITNITRFIAGSFGVVSVTGSNLRSLIGKKVKVFVDSIRKL